MGMIATNRHRPTNSEPQSKVASASTTPEPAADLGNLLRQTSRTFALGIELLRSPLREQVRTAYLVLRVSDYLEDNQVMPTQAKMYLLHLWHDILHRRADLPTFTDELQRQGRTDRIPDAEAVRNVDAIVTGLDGLSRDAREIITEHAGRSTLGMARWVERGPLFHHESDLDDYMHEVAGRVGYLLTELFALRSRRLRRRRNPLMQLGREFGLALQTVNVIRGLSSDRERGWIFVPRTFLPGHLAPSDLFEPANHAVAMQALRFLVAKAKRHFQSAICYVTLLPKSHARTRLFCLLPLFFGLKTLGVSRNNPAVLHAEVKISRKDVKKIVRRATVLGSSNAWVKWYCRRLAQPAIGEQENDPTRAPSIPILGNVDT